MEALPVKVDLDIVQETEHNDLQGIDPSMDDTDDEDYTVYGVSTKEQEKHECTICDKFFSSARALRIHTRIHTGEKPYTCSVCSESFAQYGSLKLHMGKHGIKYHHECKLCSMTFAFQSRLNAHMKTHDPNRGRVKNKRECKVCGKMVTDLSKHQVVHSGMKQFQCTFCEKSFSQAGNLNIHMQIHTGKAFLCGVCDTGFITELRLKKHLRKHHGQDSNEPNDMSMHIVTNASSGDDEISNKSEEKGHNSNFGLTPVTPKCNELSVNEDVSCGITQSNEILSGKTQEKPGNGNVSKGDNPEGSEVQRKSSESKNDNPNVTVSRDQKTPTQKRACKVCGKMVIDIRRHKLLHTSYKPYPCEICHKRFQQSGNLTSHMRIHTDEKPFKCSDCDQWFRTSSHLKAHLRIHNREQHPQRKSHCNICDRWFVDIHRHRVQHSGAKKYVCSVCNKAFIQKGNLTVHMRLHTGDRPFQCDYCEQSFISSSGLKIHMVKHDLSFSVFCSICGKRFASPAHLIAHNCSHSNLRPHKCNICGKGFKRAFNLTTHIKEQHEFDRPFKCGKCRKDYTRERELRRHLIKCKGCIRKRSNGKNLKSKSCENSVQLNSDSHVTDPKNQIQTNMPFINSPTVGQGSHTPCTHVVEDLDSSNKDMNTVKHSGDQKISIKKVKTETKSDCRDMSMVDEKHDSKCDNSLIENTAETLTRGFLLTGEIKFPLDNSQSESDLSVTGSSNKMPIDYSAHENMHELPCIKFGRCCLHGTIFQQNAMNFGMMNVDRLPLQHNPSVTGQPIITENSTPLSKLHEDETSNNALLLLQNSFEERKKSNQLHRRGDQMDIHENPSSSCYGYSGNRGNSYLETISAPNIEPSTGNHGNPCFDSLTSLQQLSKSKPEIIQVNQPRQRHRGEIKQEKLANTTSSEKLGEFEKSVLEAVNLTPKSADSIQLTASTRYECEFCKRLFVNNCELKKHRRTHTGDKPYKCDVCDKGFAQKGNLNIHKRIHTKEKPFECSVCGEKFNHKSNLKYHINKRHPDMEKMTIISA